MNVNGIIHEEYNRERDVPFAWGTADCIAWASRVAERLTGTDPTIRLRERYASEMDAKRVMVEQGWQDMSDVAREYFEQIPLSEARNGDWGIVNNRDGTQSIGVFTGQSVAAKTHKGVSIVPRRAAVAAFRVE